MGSLFEGRRQSGWRRWSREWLGVIVGHVWLPTLPKLSGHDRQLRGHLLSAVVLRRGLSILSLGGLTSRRRQSGRGDPRT
jgi:hypothetical protein